ncbi:MAG: oxidoreductase [Cyanobacteria bacterium P01_A01_bin.135]
MAPFDLAALPPQTGRVAVVTGANTGIGYETALALAKTGMTVVLACRDLAKATQAQDQIMAQVTGAKVEVMRLDLSQLASVREFAQAYRDRFSRLDLLINNAGVMCPPYSQTEDGFECQMGVNYFGHFLLTELLLDLMPDTSESRVVSLSSNAHKMAQIDFADLQSEESYSPMGAYAQSKLACLMFALELDRRLKAGEGIAAEKQKRQVLSVCAHPGGSPTELGRHIPDAVALLLQFTLLPFTHGPDQAALPTLYAALGPDVKGGDYFGPQGFLEISGEPGKVSPSKTALQEDAARELWERSERLVGLEE